jgi:hypothetical protein
MTQSLIAGLVVVMPMAMPTSTDATAQRHGGVACRRFNGGGLSRKVLVLIAQAD